MVQRARKAALVSAAVALACAWGLAGCGSGNGSSGSSDPRPAARFLDTSFGLAGQLALPDDMSSIAVTSDGTVFFGTPFHGIYKLDVTGQSVSPVEASPAYALAADKSGKSAYAAYNNGVFKFTAAGRDTGYATSGMALPNTPAAGVIWTLAPLPDGSLYVILLQSQGSGWSAVVIVKLGADGLPVASFGDGGRVTHQLGSITSLGSSAIDSAGSLYVSFSNLEAQNARMNVAKFDRDGRLVASFANGGVWSGSKTRCDPWGVAVDASGFVWLPGACTDAKGVFVEALVKLDPNGVPVPGFGKDGYLEGFYGPLQDKTAESIATGIVPAPDGTMYVRGYAVVAGCVEYRLVALDSQGNRITSFGTDGTLLGGRLAAVDAANRLYVVSRTSSCRSGQTPPDVLSRYL